MREPEDDVLDEQEDICLWCGATVYECLCHLDEWEDEDGEED